MDSSDRFNHLDAAERLKGTRFYGWKGIGGGHCIQLLFPEMAVSIIFTFASYVYLLLVVLYFELD